MTNNKGKYEKDLEEAKRLPGFGKSLPKNLFSGDIYSNFLKTAKEAGYLPPFVVLQKEIRQDVVKLLKMIEDGKSIAGINSLITEVNTKIKKYNMECPRVCKKC